jgi:hypothetical protein
VSAEGVFHDAHEVYALETEGWEWVATFAAQGLARNYVTMLEIVRDSDIPTIGQTSIPAAFEVRPV